MSRFEQKKANGFSTTFALMAEFQTALIPLEIVATKYLGISEKKARERFHRAELPFPVCALIDSQKAPLWVRVEDLAAYIDRTVDRAKNEQTHLRV
jgi:hypothetical protein